MTEKKNGAVTRTVKLTVRIYDGRDREPKNNRGVELGADPFDSFTYPIEDVEDAVLRFVEEREGLTDDGDSELVTDGEFSFDGDEAKISYSDPFADGAESSVTEISFSAESPETVFVVRSNGSDTVLVLEEGKTNTTVFEVSPVPIEMRVFAKKVTNHISVATGKGEMVLDYLVSFAGAPSSRTVMELRSE